MAFQLTPHFSYEELVNTSKLDLLPRNSLSGVTYLGNAIYLAEFLELLRSYLGDRPLRVNSGYRCRALNQKVGGVSASDHLSFLAVDIPIFCVERAKQLDEAIKKVDENVLNDFKVRYVEWHKTYVHISLCPPAVDRLSFVDDAYILSLYQHLSLSYA